MSYAAPRLSREQYEAFGGWNASLLKVALSKTPAHAFRAFLAPDREPSNETPAMRVGTLVHLALLEPPAFEEVLVTDKGTTTKAYQLELAQAEADGRRLVPLKERDLAAAMAAAIRSHPNVGAHFPKDGHDLNELSLCWTTADDVKCRARLDALRWTGSSLWIGDLKSAADAGPDEFGRSAVNFNYLLQAAFYADGVRACGESLDDLLDLPAGTTKACPMTFEFVVVEKEPPHNVARYVVTPDQIALGRRMYERALTLVEAARLTDYWPGYDYAARPLELPPWAERSIARLTEGT